MINGKSVLDKDGRGSGKGADLEVQEVCQKGLLYLELLIYKAVERGVFSTISKLISIGPCCMQLILL